MNEIDRKHVDLANQTDATPEAVAATVACPFYARTFSATTRHIIKPDTGGKRTLCGHAICLPDEYIDDAGKLARPDRWMILDLPPCGRCERSATSRGLCPRA